MITAATRKQLNIGRAAWFIGLIVLIVNLSLSVDAQQRTAGNRDGYPQAGASHTADPDAVAWLDRRQLGPALAQPLKITLQDVPIREAVRRLSQATRVAIWLDRRIDPSHQIDLEPADLTLAQTLAAIGQQVDAGVGRVGPVVYVGPRLTADSLATRAALLEDHVSTLPKGERGKWTREKQVNWPYPTAVREIWSQVTADGPSQLTELARSTQLPHDLWPDQSLPPMRMGELLTLILSGFDLHLRPQGDGWILAHNGDQPPTMAREYDIPAAFEPTLRQLARQHDRSTTRRRGPKVSVDGPWEMHEALQRLLHDHRRPASDTTTTGDGRSGNGRPDAGRPPRRRGSVPEVRLQLRVQDQPLRAVLRYLEEHQQLTFDIPDELIPQLDQRVTLEVQDATLDDLLRQLAQAANLRMSRSGQAVRVTSAASTSPP